MQIATMAGFSPACAQWACNELIWPAMETVQDLYAAGLVSQHRFNAAFRLLDKVMTRALEGIAPVAPIARSAMIFTIPGEREEFGACLLSRLAELHGWTVYFAGGNLTVEEVMFAIGRLTPDALVIHAGLSGGENGVAELIKKLQRVGVWPAAQVTVCGRAVEGLRSMPGIQADILARTPVELLELMQLCPDHRWNPGMRWLSGNHERLETPLDEPLMQGGGEVVPEPIRRRIAGGLGSPEWN
jgi:methanogenic corrinoid protein MtbC1